MPKFNKDKLGEFLKTIPETPWEEISKEEPEKEEKGNRNSSFFNEKDYSSREEYERARRVHRESLVEKITNPEIIDRESTVEEIAEILKNNKIDQIIIAGEKQQNKERQALRLHPDLDSELALYLLNNFNKRKPEEMYNDGAVVSVINKNGTGKELIEDKKGVKIYLDTGGNWLKIEKDGETTTLYIDHHGTGQREPTSGAKMTAEIMEKAGILKEKPEWLNKLIDFVNDIDNSTYLDKKGNKTFTENYFRNEWPASLYALAEKKIPLNLLIDLCEKGIIKDLTKPFTDEELNGEIGKIKIAEQTIKDLCLEQRKEMSTTLDVGIKNSIQNNEKEGINLEKTRLGKIIYQNYFKIRGKVNIIPDHLAFKATIAKGYDTYIAFNKQKGVFSINSKNQNLSNVVEELNKKYPGCAIDIRGVMVYGKIIDSMTEEEFLNIIDPKILEGKNKVPKKEKQEAERNVATPDISEPEIAPEEKNTTYESQKENTEKRKEEAEKLHNNSVLTAGDNGFVVKESKSSYEIAKDLRSFIQKQATANQTGVIYKFKDDNNVYNYAVSTYDAKRGAGIGYVGYSVGVDKDTLLTDEEIYEILENNLNAAFDQKFPNKETWETDKDVHISSIEKNNFEKIKAKYEIELAELDKKYSKNQEKNSGENQDIKNEKEKQEKIDAIVEQFMQSILKTNELKKKLIEIIEKENESTEENAEGGREETKNLFDWSFPNYVDPEGRLDIKINDNDDIIIKIKKITSQATERTTLGKVFHSTIYKHKKLKEPYWLVGVEGEDNLENKYPDRRFDNENDAIDRASKIINECKERIKAQIEEDRKEKPFLYYAIEKSNNNILKGWETNKVTGMLDLRKFENNWHELSWNFLKEIAKDEGCFEFNIFGFIKVIKNVNEITDRDEINSRSEKAIYKVLGPNEEIIADNIQGFNEADKIYHEATEKYKKQVEEEFNKLDNK